jgi:hypothetical protein
MVLEFNEQPALHALQQEALSARARLRWRAFHVFSLSTQSAKMKNGKHPRETQT